MGQTWSAAWLHNKFFRPFIHWLEMHNNGRNCYLTLTLSKMFNYTYTAQHSTRVMNCQVLENVAGNNYSRTTEKRRKIILLRKERRGSAVCGIRPSSYCSYWSMQNPVGAATSKAICIRSLSIRWSRTIFFLLLFCPFRCLQHDHSSSLIDNATKKKKRHKVNEWEKRREKKKMN